MKNLPLMALIAASPTPIVVTSLYLSSSLLLAVGAALFAASCIWLGKRVPDGQMTNACIFLSVYVLFLTWGTTWVIRG